MLILFLIILNIRLIRDGGAGDAIAAALLNGLPIGVIVAFYGGPAWYSWAAWIAAGLLADGFMAGWVLRFWNGKRFALWLACFVLAAGGITGSLLYDRHLEAITLPEHFNYGKGDKRALSTLEPRLVVVISAVFHNQSWLGSGKRPFDIRINYETYTPFTEGSLVKTLDGEASLRFAEEDALPRMDGATALYPVYAAFAQAVYPDAMAGLSPDEIRETVACHTTAAAWAAIVDGECDIIFVAGPSAKQEAYAAEKGMELVCTPIGREAFVFFVHPDNPVQSLTLAEIKGIYAGEITRWDQLGVSGLGGILAYQREEGSGSQTALQRFVMRDTPLMPPATETVRGSMGDMVERVSAYRNHRNAIGYSFRFYCTALMKGFDVKLLAVNGVQPTVANIENGAYPLASDFYAVTRADADENTLALLEWICSAQGQALVEKAGYTPV